MIGRLWRGWTRRENADAYEALLRNEFLPGIHRVPGYRGAYLFRRKAAGEVEFVTLTLFESMDAVRAFAGDDVERAVVPAKARALLARFDERSAHYRTLVEPRAAEDGPAEGGGSTAGRHVFWEPWSDPGFEHLCFETGRDALVADGMILRQAAGAPAFRLRYRLKCDGSARVRAAEMRLWPGDGERDATLLSDGAGRWTDGRGRPLPALDGCLDLDIAATPFTNTLPIRRLGLRPGSAAEIAVAYVSVPDLRVTRARQRYTCLRAEGGGSVYLYENVDNGFRAELPVDADGIVRDYPGQWRRRDPAGAAL